MTAFRTGDRGVTARSHPYRILSDDLQGRVGPLAVGVIRDEVEWLIQYPANGLHPGGLKYLDLMAPRRPA